MIKPSRQKEVLALTQKERKGKMKECWNKIFLKQRLKFQRKGVKNQKMQQ